MFLLFVDFEQVTVSTVAITSASNMKYSQIGARNRAKENWLGRGRAITISSNMVFAGSAFIDDSFCRSIYNTSE